MRALRIPTLGLLLAAGLVAACARVPPAPRTEAWTPREAAAPVAPAATPRVRPKPYAASLVAGTSVEGRPLWLEVRGVGSDVVFVFAAIHGNEPAGTPLSQALLAHLDAHPEVLENRRVLVMPDANPDGHVANTRGNAHGVDLNRDFDARAEPEAAAVERVVRLYRPARILSIHQPLRCVDWDGPAEGLAREVARRSGLPVKKLGTRPGSFGAWAEAHGVTLVTLELPPRSEVLSAEALWRRYGPALLAFATAP